MTRKFLSNLGIAEDETITAILNAHQAVVQPLKDEISTANEKVQATENALAKAQEPVEGAIEWESKFNDEVAAHKATRDGYEAEKSAAEVAGLLTTMLADAGMNAAAIPKAIKLCDRTTIERDKDGTIKNADKVLDRFKDEWKDFFGEVQQKGADVGTSSNVSTQKNPWLKDHRNLAEQTRIYRENPALAVQMAAAAGITIK